MNGGKMFDEHEGGQLRLGAAGDQLALLALPSSSIPASDGPELASPALEESRELVTQGVGEGLAGYERKYAVKCDECKTEIRRTFSVAESAAGGLCDDCRKDPGVVGHTRARLERKAEKRAQWAESRAAKSSSAYEGARRIMDGIPVGQPILVGHHSEKRHRKDIDRIDRGMRASFEHAEMARDHEHAAGEIRSQLERSIYSDDVDAVERLEERIDDLETERNRVKTYNALRRARKPARPNEGMTDDAIAAGLTPAELEGLLSGMAAVPYQYEPVGAFPPYHLQNLGGNIKRNRDRLEQLRRARDIVAAGGRGRARIMAARFSSSCAECGETIEKGETIAYYKLVREAVHARCEKEA